MEESLVENTSMLEGLGKLREKFDVVELASKINRKGDLPKLSKHLRIKPRTLALAKEEGRILSYFPHLEKSKSVALARLRSDREILVFAQKYDIYKTAVRDLRKLVKEWNKDIQRNPLIFISQKEHDMIIGSLLGDASIRQRERNSCFRVAHPIKQEAYLDWKFNVLKNFTISEFYKKTRIINKREVQMVNLATRTHPVFNYYRNLFYKNNSKRVSKEILEQLNPRNLAVWVCDDGSFSRTQGYIILCTNSFNFEEHKLMKEFFNEKFGLRPTIGFRDKKYYYLRFKKEDSQKLIKIIKPYIPQCMQYKIGENKNE